MSTFYAVEDLLHGSLLSTLPTWLTGRTTLATLTIPADGAQVMLRPAGDLVDEVTVYPNRDGTGVPLDLPLVADADGRVPGYVAQPAQIDAYVTRPGASDLVMSIGHAVDVVTSAPNVWTDTQAWQNKTTVSLLSAPSGSTLPAGSTVMSLDEYGSVMIGPSIASDLLPPAGDIHSIAPSGFYWSNFDLRPHTPFLFGKCNGNPFNMLMGRYPGSYPFIKGWSKPNPALMPAGFTLPAIGTCSFNINLLDTSGFNTGLAHPAEAILREGLHLAHVQYDTWAGNVLHVIQVIDDNMPGTAFSTAVDVSDAVLGNTPIGLIYAAPFNGVKDGFRDRCSGMTLRNRDTARPDPSMDGNYFQAGSITWHTSPPGPNSIRTDRLMLDETGALALLGAGIGDASSANRRVTVAAATATLRRHTTFRGGGASFAIPGGAYTLQVSDVLSTRMPASGTIQVKATMATLSAQLTPASGVTGALPVNALTALIPAGTVLTFPGTNALGTAINQAWTTTVDAHPADVTVTVTPQTPNGTYPIGAAGTAPQTITYNGLETSGGPLAHQLLNCTGGNGAIPDGQEIDLVIALPAEVLYVSDATTFGRATGTLKVSVSSQIITVGAVVKQTDPPVTVTASTTNASKNVTAITPALIAGRVYSIYGPGVPGKQTITITGAGDTGTLSTNAIATGAGGTFTLHLGAALTGCSGGTGTVLANSSVNLDITSNTIIAGFRGQLAASDTGAGQVTIGNTHGGLPGILFGPSGSAELYSPSAGFIRTPGSLTVDGTINIGAPSSNGWGTIVAGPYGGVSYKTPLTASSTLGNVIDYVSTLAAALKTSYGFLGA